MTEAATAPRPIRARAALRRFGRGPAGAVEGSWSGAPGALPWTVALQPAALLYEAWAARARAKAASTRRAVPGVRVIAVGNLTVGGTGKSSVARWVASRVASTSRAAVLLRGHGGSRASETPEAVPDFPGYPLRHAAERFGDEAAAHRAALAPETAVIVGRDRRRSAVLARDGYGARAVVLDDGWEQGTLAWDALWVAVDPERPSGNGLELPAGPLRRPEATLADAAVVVFVLEHPEQRVSNGALDGARRLAPSARVIRFRRALHALEPAGERGGKRAVTNAASEPVLLLTGVGAPERVERFVLGEGIEVLAHAAFPDHARVDAGRLRDTLQRAARGGARAAVITEKDEHRWRLPDHPPIPVLVLRTGLVPLDAVDGLPGLEP